MCKCKILYVQELHHVLMNRIPGKVEGDVTITEDTQLNGMIVGNATVSRNVTLIAHGLITGNLILSEAAISYVYGTVDGNIINNGGHLEVFGYVKGKVVRQSGETIIDPNAKIDNVES
jgi:hypothetical protein